MNATNNILTSKQQYYAGEVVTGQIQLNLTAPFQFTSLSITLTGYERIRLTGNKIERNQAFYSKIYTVPSSAQVLQPGSYVIPFEFKLDETLPGSVCVESKHVEHDYKGIVYYNIGAEASIPGLGQPYLLTFRDLLVSQPLKWKLDKLVLHKEENINLLCCMSKGQVSMTITSEKNAYAPGEQVRLEVTLDASKSSSDIESVSIEFKESVILMLTGTEFQSPIETLFKTKMKGLAKGRTEQRSISFKIPETAHTTCSSKKLKVYHGLYAKMKCGALCNGLEIKSDVQLYTFSQALPEPPCWSNQPLPSDEKMRFTEPLID